MKRNKKSTDKLNKSSIIFVSLVCLGFVIFIVLYYFPTRIVLYGNRYKNNSKRIDLTKVEEIDVNELLNNIPYFNHLNTITFADGAISYDDRLKLINKYPMLNFDGAAYIDFYGIKVLENAEVINLNTSEVDDTFIYRLGAFHNVKKVILYNQDITKEDIEKYKSYYPNIEFVCKIAIGGVFVDSNIDSLDLSNKIIEDKDAFKYALTRLDNLKTLDMSYTNFSNEELGALREEFPNITIDWVLFLSKWSFRTDVVSFSVLVTRFDYKKITSPELEVFKYTRNMQTLDLGHQNITDVSAIPKYMPNLKLLILADNKIKDITPLADLKKLTYIELFLNDITDISPLASCQNLKDVNICYNPHLKDISPLYQIPNLERIWLVNLGIPMAEINKLQAAYPNAMISIYGDGSTDGGWRGCPKYYEMIKMFRNRYYKSEKFFDIE